MAQSYLTMDPGEEVLFTRHKHWINIVPVFISTALLIIVGSYALGWLLANSATVAAGIPAAAISLVVIVIEMISVLVLLIAYLIFRQNRVILTNRHYMQIDQTGLFNRTVSKLTLDEIQDCKGNRRGLFATILNYGEILIETAGEDENFDFSPIADPLNLSEAINDAHQKYGHRAASNLNPNPPVAPEAPPTNPNPPVDQTGPSAVPPVSPPTTPDNANGVDPGPSA